MSRSPVTRKSKKPFLKFDADAFERDLVDGEVGLYRALEYLRKTVASGGTCDAISALLAVESNIKLLEYALSVADDGTAFLLREELVDGFDLSTPDTSRSSFLALARLAGFIVFLQFPEGYPVPPAQQNFQFIQSAQTAISILGDAGLLRQETTAPAQNDGETSPKIAKRKLSVSQKQAKQQTKRLRKNTISIDDRPFRLLNEPVPSSHEEAVAVAQRLLEKQKTHLNSFVDILRDPLLSEIIREQCIPSRKSTSSPNPTKANEAEDRNSTGSDSLPDSLPVYPRVQPLKASLFFESAEGFGEWRIFMSTTAIRDMRNYSRDRKVFEVILKKIRELSNGFFSGDNQKKLKGRDKGVPIFEAKMTGDLRLVYQVDVAADFEHNCDIQGIRVYGIFTHAQMDERMWASLSAQLARKGPEYRRRIEFRRKPRNLGDNVYLPQSWPDVISEESLGDSSSNFFVDVNDRESIHQWLVLEKYSTFSKELLDCILHDKDSSMPFSVSPYEREVIEHPSSCYVLGRSGTGKTTTMTFKIYGIERTVRARSNELERKPRQLFVTQSRVLANRVKDYYDKLSGQLSASGLPSESTSDDPSQTVPDDLGDPDEEDEWRDELPKRFSELEDRHFPLFLTFDKLCKLVEADLGISFVRATYTKEHRRAEQRYNLSTTAADLELDDMLGVDSEMVSFVGLDNPGRKSGRNNFIDFESFCGRYWPHFPQDLTKNLDPALVFSEFLGVIKGSQESLKSENGYLSREEYLGLSERTRSTFANRRDRIYRLFERYSALKTQYGDYDLADRSHAVIRGMKGGIQFSVDYLYVDEAQDNLIIDAFLLRYLCSNPHGLFWAGDTAQTIAIGSSFRFDDLKSSLYSFERELYPSAPEKLLVQPSFFQLTTNYRSHGGIVNCAGLIIELITYFWPHSIDSLQKEKGLVDGSKPIFFTGWNDDTARYEQFLLGENGNPIEFGASQCILVRNDQARNELRKQVGKLGIILTLYESKGLEFDDVLLYNFFEDSNCVLSQWRVVLNLLPVSEESKIARPMFDELRHAGICTELKFLYVAITRARKNLWIIDRSEKGEPMKTLLLHRGNIDLRSPDRAPQLAVASSPAEWAKTGKLLFDNKRFPQAMHCFERAGLDLERDIAKAFHLRQLSRSVDPKAGERARLQASKEAGDAFSECAENCVKKFLASRRKYFHIAAECYLEAREIYEAAKAYENAEEYMNSAKCYAKALKFEDAVRIVRTKTLDFGARERIIGAARLYYIRVGRLDKAMELFDSQEDGLEFMEDFGFETAKASFLEKIGRIHEAADVYFREGQTEEAIGLLLNDSNRQDSLARAVDYLRTSLWNQYPFGIDAQEEDEAGRAKALQLIQKVDKTKLDEEIVAEVAMFDAIHRRDKDHLLSAYKDFGRRRNPQAALLILHHLLTPDYRVEEMQDAVEYAEACLAYADILRDLRSRPLSAENIRTQRLFGFRKQSDDEFLLVNGSFLATYLRSSGSQSGARWTSETGIIIGSSELLAVIKSSVTSRLYSVAGHQVDILTKTRHRLFRELCLDHAVQDRCRQQNECTRQHIDVRTANVEWFNLRLRFQLLQIVSLHLHMSSGALRNLDMRKLQRECLSSLFSTLNPPLLALGSVVNAASSRVPEFSRAMNVLPVWIENRVYQIDPNCASYRWFLNEVVETATLASVVDGPRARTLLHRARFYTSEGLRPMFSQALEQLRIPDLLKVLDSTEPDLIKSGSDFISNVIRNRLRIKVDHVCRLVELLCATSVLLYKARDNFHDCLLPKSWFSQLVSKLKFDQAYNIRTVDLVKRSGDLAMHLLNSAEHERQSHLNATAYVVRCLAIQRICRAISLVGYNTHRDLRDVVIGVFSSLRAGSVGSLHKMLWPFLMADGWSGIRRAAERSVPSSDLDEMIHLVHIGRKPVPLASDAKIRQVYFKDRDHLISLASAPHREWLSILSADAPVFVPRAGAIPINPPTRENEAAQVAQADAEIGPIHEEAGTTEDPSVCDDRDVLQSQQTEAEVPSRPLHFLRKFLVGLGHSFATNLAPSGSSALLEAEVLTNKKKVAGRIILRFLRMLRSRKRALVILRWYRAIRAQRRELESPGLIGIRARVYRDCMHVDFERGGQWPTRNHRLVFLGVIPNLLVCLDTIRVRLQSNKSRARRLELQSAEADIDYEQLHERMKQASEDRNRLNRLKKNLKVTSNWHEKRTREDLATVVKEIDAFLNSLMIEGPERDFCSGAQIVVENMKGKRRAPPPQNRTKPELNTDDLY